MRLRCRSASDCEMQMIDGSAQARSPDALSFKSAVPLQRGYAPARDALKYALEHRAESGPNPEFAALHKLLAVAAGAKTEIDACIGLDAKQPEFFMVCTLRGATSFRPTVLLFGSLLGLCGQGFCKHVIYPLVKTGP
jgi:hypothetical protein